MITPWFSAETARPWLAGLDPRVKLTWVFAVSVAAIMLDTAASLGCLAAASFVVSLGLRLQSRGWTAVVVILALAAWGTILSQGFFYHDAPTRTPVLTIIAPSADDPLASGLVLSQEGMLDGAVQSLRIVATALAGFTLSLSTGPERLLAALALLRIPIALCYMTAAALRSLPTIVEEVAQVRQARRLRGYRFRLVGRPGDRLGSYREELGLLFPVVAAALRRAETSAESITARGFDAAAPRTFYPPLTMRPLERAIVAGLLVGSLVLSAAALG